MTTLATLVPDTFRGIADALAAATADGAAVTITGGGSKPWAPAVPDGRERRTLSTTGLDRILAHDPGDMTASLEAGVPLAVAQAAFARAGQMLALDPPLGAGDAATIGGVVATGDSGPLAHRHGDPRDLVVGATFALADGTIASSGGTVIKNVAGYDVARLLCGSHGTLGAILSVNVRLHPRHPAVTVLGVTGEPARLTRAAARLAAAPAELQALDVAWRDGTGTLLAAVAGPQATPRARRLDQILREAGLDDVAVEEDGDALWARERDGQRSQTAAVLLIAHPPSRLGAVLGAAAAVDATLVARAGVGRAHVTVEPGRVAELRARLPTGATSVLRDCPSDRRAEIADPWGETPAPALALMRAVKERFDPALTCNPGTFVGGI